MFLMFNVLFLHLKSHRMCRPPWAGLMTKLYSHTKNDFAYCETTKENIDIEMNLPCCAPHFGIYFSCSLFFSSSFCVPPEFMSLFWLPSSSHS